MGGSVSVGASASSMAEGKRRGPGGGREDGQLGGLQCCSSMGG